LVKRRETKEEGLTGGKKKGNKTNTKITLLKAKQTLHSNVCFSSPEINTCKNNISLAWLN
jgi:hypothetical protein